MASEEKLPNEPNSGLTSTTLGHYEWRPNPFQPNSAIQLWLHIPPSERCILSPIGTIRRFPPPETNPREEFET